MYFVNGDFKSFRSIENIDKFLNLDVCITQKIHGTNAQILVEEKKFINSNTEKEWSMKKINIGSRTRWLTEYNDNYGFYNFISQNREEFLKLPRGRYYGEWCGKGINAGEGLTDRKLVLFNHHLKLDSLPPQTVLVPVLFEGKIKISELNDVINDTMNSLKQNGSVLCLGFMEPEGIVISINGTLYKKIFERENKPIKPKSTYFKTDYSYLCQPIRLEKLLSRDQSFTYIENLVTTVKEYFADLIKESEITGTKEEIQKITKEASRQVFSFIKKKIGA